MIRRPLLLLSLCLGALTTLGLSACSVPQLAFPGVYRINIPQGNIISQEMVDQLRPGLTKQQVNFILGTPLIRDTFDQDRWDYLYSFQRGGGERVQERLSVFFENGELVSIGGDFTQSPENASFAQPAAESGTAQASGERDTSDQRAAGTARSTTN